jgi:hypothetical protein
VLDPKTENAATQGQADNLARLDQGGAHEALVSEAITHAHCEDRPVRTVEQSGELCTTRLYTGGVELGRPLK